MSLYAELDVEKGASADEIKKAYRKLAIKFHPDKVGASEKASAEERFKRITEAYTVLSDDDKRKHYDMFGTTDGSGGGGGGFPGDMGDLFRNMFSGASPFGEGFNPFGFGGGGGQRGPKHDTCHCEVTYQEVYEGTMKKIEYDVLLQCQTCNGQGAMDPSDIIKCMQCAGRGVIIQQMGPMVLQTQCPACFGGCTTIKTNKACGNCKGKKFANYHKTVKIEVPCGIPDRFEYRLAGKGNYNREANCQNDLVVIFVHKIPDGCTPQGNEGTVLYNTNLKLEELLCGFTKTINIYGKDLKIASQGYFNPSQTMTFKGHGLPVYKREGVAGDLMVSFNMIYENETRIGKYIDVFLTIYKRTAVSDDELKEKNVLKIS